MLYLGAVFAGIFATDLLIHSVWLKKAYEGTPELWRPEPEMLDRAAWILRGQFITALAFVLLWALFGAPGNLRGGPIRFKACPM